MNREHAFTIIELMITLALAVTLLALGVPAMQDMLRNNRMVDQTNTLVSDIQLGRSEAIKRNSRVVICQSNDLATPACGGTSQVWSTGWLVFADDNANSTFEAGTDPVIRIGYGPDGDTTIYSNSGASTRVIFAPDGTLIGTGASFAVCDGRASPENFGRQLDIGAMGRPRLTRGTLDSPIGDCTFGL